MIKLQMPPNMPEKDTISAVFLDNKKCRTDHVEPVVDDVLLVLLHIGRFEEDVHDAIVQIGSEKIHLFLLNNRKLEQKKLQDYRNRWTRPKIDSKYVGTEIKTSIYVDISARIKDIFFLVYLNYNADPIGPLYIWTIRA